MDSLSAKISRTWEVLKIMRSKVKVNKRVLIINLKANIKMVSRLREF